ncbi:TIGR02186 family protein [Pelagibacteraceae bacterium]|nr:TIGR02186 family protein [Pelagibacteraceae bacterium]
MIKNLFINPSFILSILLTNVFFNNFLQADEIYFDLSEDNIELKTDFKGKEIIIFGLLKDDHETLLTIKGPPSKMRIQKKERHFGIWINNQYVTYSNIPSLFFLSASKKINEILPESILINEDLSFEKILNNKTFNQNFIFKNDQEDWNNNFVRIKKEQSFYKSFKMKKVKDKLFQTSVFFPTNTIPGIYNVNIYYIRNNTIMSNDQKKIVIKKSGIGSKIFDFANNNAATYGVFVVIFSIFSGFIAATLFRRSK